MELSARLAGLVQAVGADVKSLFSKIGTLTSLGTNAKTDLVSAINELKSGSNASAAVSGVAVGGDVSLNVNNAADSTAVYYAHRSQLNYTVNFDILSGGWLSAYGGMVNVTGNGDIDKVVAAFSQTHLSNNGIVKSALGYEAVLSTVGANADVRAWAAYYVPTMRSVANIDTVDTLGAFINDDPKAVSWTMSSFFNSTKQEFSPANHTGIIPGRVYSAACSSFVEGQLNPGYVYLIPVTIPHRTNVSSMGIRISTASAAGGKMRLGIYGNIGGKVSGKKFGSNEIAIDSTGIKEIAITDVTLDAGVHWLALTVSAVCGAEFHTGNVGVRSSFSGQSAEGLAASQIDFQVYIATPYAAFPDVVDVYPAFASGTTSEPHVWFKGSAATGFGAMGALGTVSGPGAGGVGEITTAANLGTVGQGVYAQKVGTELQFKKLIAGNAVSMTANATSITIDVNDAALGAQVDAAQTFALQAADSETAAMNYVSQAQDAALAAQDAAAGNIIDDGAPAANAVWSSEKVSTVLADYTKIAIGTTAPPNPVVGQLWVDTN